MQQSSLSLTIPLTLLPILLLILWRIGLRRLKRYSSPLLGTIGIWQKYNGEKVLTINSYPQGVSTEKNSIKKSYWFFIADKINKFCKKRPHPQVLLLGLGAATIPNLIAKLNPEIHQTIIEIDKYIIQACREYFHLDHLPSYQIIRADAYQFFDQPEVLPREYFDTIVVDIFTGDPPFISSESNQPPFIKKLLPFLKNDGLIIFNRPSHNPKARRGSELLKSHLAAFFQKTDFVHIDDPRGYKTDEVMGSGKK
ncbi:MAG: hypothetical protein M1142_03305 [Patescibacteria group bacterium]|nr:hypothetical protein [Patescibacteria group bacterium]